MYENHFSYNCLRKNIYIISYKQSIDSKIIIESEIIKRILKTKSKGY